MRFAHFYNNETLCRMEAIFERTCADLGIQDGSEYARSARETLAHLMFEVALPDTGLIQPAADRLQDVAVRRRLVARKAPPPCAGR